MLNALGAQGADFYQESLRTKEIQQKLRKRNERAVESGRSNSESVIFVHVTYQVRDLMK